MTILEGLQSINDYPTKVAKLTTIATRRGLDLTETLTDDVMKSGAYLLATADIYSYLSQAPSISQGGVTISFDANQRSEFKRIAMGIYADEDETTNNTYGYKGADL